MNSIRGWFDEPVRHSLASNGVHTIQKVKAHANTSELKKPKSFSSLKSSHDILATHNNPPKTKTQSSPNAEITWELNRTGLPLFDEIFFNPDNPKRKYDGYLVTLPLDTFIDYQIHAMMQNPRVRETVSKRNYTPRDVFYEEASEENIDKITDLIKQGERFHPLALEFDTEGNITNFQEGRHRALALKELGFEEIPVWLMKERTGKEKLVEQYGSVEDIPPYIDIGDNS